MYRFSEVTYDPNTQTVVVGTGLNFDDVYAALAPYNVSVAGGRVTGIGVGGFLLGGGYSWKGNQYGLAIDTITAYELVKPNGRVVQVTEESDAELFFGLKGGYNNFGIVTRFTVKALPQPSVWGGSIIYPETSVPDLTDAVVKFSKFNDDPKANIITSYIYIQHQYLVSQLFYYDGPSPPSGLFDEFLTIPSVTPDVRERSLSDFISKTNSNGTANLRGLYETVPLLEHTPNILKVIQNETTFWGKTLPSENTFIGYSVEPFLPSLLSHNDKPTAYPPTRDKVYLPFNIYFGWADAALDNVFYEAIRQSAAHIRAAAIKEGQDIADAPLYPNYALYDTPLRDLYGDNVRKLRSLRKRVDPGDVMGLAGSFKF
ncbi:hypothetical protein AX15_002727 [Amanita polypyramis BW_CC]|nr:hypothetical protein AX15_002727 [Amanita polypyramis BW_CC]